MGKIMNSVSIWGLFFCPLPVQKNLAEQYFFIKSIFFEKKLLYLQ